MITIEEALAIVLKSVRELKKSEVVTLGESLDRIIAEDIKADCDVPFMDNSAMDGYAVKARDTKGASRQRPRILSIVGDVRAGYVSERDIKNGEAIKIMTGAPIPRGADGVVIVENTDLLATHAPSPKYQAPNNVKIFREVNKGDNIRIHGEDIKKGEIVIKKGSKIGPSHIGVIASSGKSMIKVKCKPVIAILATGDEVIDIDEKVTPGKLRNTNTYTLMSQAKKSGATGKNLGIAKDNKKDIRKKFKKGFGSDMIITSGGVSVGDYDYVKDVLDEMGQDMKFWKVAIKPGKPMTFGFIKGIPVFGLPGNPVSSMVAFETFVKPAINKMLGANAGVNEGYISAFLDEDIRKPKGRRHFMRAITRCEGGKYVTRTTGPQGSAILKSMVLANSLIIVPEDVEYIAKGSVVNVRWL